MDYFIKTEKANRPFKGKVLAAMGDSWIDALWAGVPGGFPYLGHQITAPPASAHWLNLLETHTGMKVINKGIAGDVTDDLTNNPNDLPGMLTRFNADILGIFPRPDYCIILGGGNDIYRGWDVDTFIMPNITEMVNRCKTYEIIPIVCSYPIGPNQEQPIPVATQNERIAYLHTQLDAYTTTNNILFFDFWDAGLTLGSSDYLFDGVHLSAQGDMKVAVYCLGRFSNLIPVPSPVHRKKWTSGTVWSGLSAETTISMTNVTGDNVTIDSNSIALVAPIQTKNWTSPTVWQGEHADTDSTVNMTSVTGDNVTIATNAITLNEPVGTLSLLHFDGNTADVYGTTFSVSGTPAYVTGKFSQAVYLSGTQKAYRNLGAIMTDLTIEAWVQRVSNSVGFYFGFDSNKLGFMSTIDDYDTALLFNGATIGYNYAMVGSFTHLTITYKKSTNYVELYINGIKQYQGTMTAFPTDDFVMGKPSVALSPSSVGMYVDELRISNKIIYTANFTPPTVPFSS